LQNRLPDNQTYTVLVETLNPAQSINQRNMDNDSEDVTSSGRSFQVRGTGRQTGVRLATVVNLTGSTITRLQPSEWRVQRPGKSAT